jgi:hypothetical protein
MFIYISKTGLCLNEAAVCLFYNQFRFYSSKLFYDFAAAGPALASHWRTSSRPGAPLVGRTAETAETIDIFLLRTAGIFFLPVFNRKERRLENTWGKNMQTYRGTQ